MREAVLLLSLVHFLEAPHARGHLDGRRQKVGYWGLCLHLAALVTPSARGSTDIQNLLIVKFPCFYEDTVMLPTSQGTGD